tara:strand:+ start:363 stop:1454 length:1092 start_codon:yes stop_codon:yes gene_type:complete
MSKAAELANLIGNINAGGGGVNKNAIINGAMNVAQRGTSSTGLGASSGYFVCDRWRFSKGGDASAGRFTMTQDSSAPEGFANSMKLDCTTADTSIAAGEFLLIGQRIEGQNMQTFAKGTSSAKPFAVSFYVKGNASATYVCELVDQDNTRQISKTFNVTTDWTRIELSFPADTTGTLDDDNAKSFELSIWLHAGSTYNSGTLNSSSWASLTDANRAVGISSFFDSTDRTFFITGVQLEVGQNPTEFESEPFGVTFDKCERYLQVFAQDNANAHVASGYYHSTTSLRCHMPFRQKMRAVPTGSIVNVGDFFVQDGGATAAPSAIATANNNDTSMLTVTTSSRTAGNGGALLSDESSSIRMDAEL